VVKFRGSTHGTNEYPFLIDEDGITVMPITSAGLQHGVSNELVSSGIERLDAMLGGGGYYRGSTVLVSGTAGAGKSSMSAHFADATCGRGERCLLFSFEESPPQFIRNMASVGVDLARHVDAGLLKFVAARPTAQGLETHLAVMHKEVRDFAPTTVIIDPISNLSSVGRLEEAHMMVVRLVDYLKTHNITTLMTSLTAGGATEEATDVGISSIVDSWLLVKSLEANGERNRLLYVLKSRGMAHSNQVREFVLTSNGVQLVDVYVGPEGVLTGSARVQQESREREAALQRDQDIERRQLELERKRQAMESQIAALRAQYEDEEAEIARSIRQRRAAEERLASDRAALAGRRGADDR
jgi:circadian clock protein KaiC